MNDLNNFRGISVLHLTNKLFEKAFASQIKDYFEKLFFSGQYGFRAGHSCEMVLHEYISPCLASLDNKEISLFLFVDFKKTSNTILI